MALTCVEEEAGHVPTSRLITSPCLCGGRTARGDDRAGGYPPHVSENSTSPPAAIGTTGDLPGRQLGKRREGVKGDKRHQTLYTTVILNFIHELPK